MGLLLPPQTGRADLPHPAFPRSFSFLACTIQRRSAALLLLGLVAQLASQFRDFPRQRHPRLHLRYFQRRNAVVACLFFRKGTFVQADLLMLTSSMISAGFLRSTAVKPLPRYYEPLRLPLATSPLSRLVTAYRAGLASADFSAGARRVSPVPQRVVVPVPAL